MTLQDARREQERTRAVFDACVRRFVAAPGNRMVREQLLTAADAYAAAHENACRALDRAVGQVSLLDALEAEPADLIDRFLVPVLDGRR